jgi:hypothetical protein
MRPGNIWSLVPLAQVWLDIFSFCAKSEIVPTKAINVALIAIDFGPSIIAVPFFSTMIRRWIPPSGTTYGFRFRLSIISLVEMDGPYPKS